MAAYFIVDVQVNDPEVYAEYRKRVMPTLEKYGGRFLVRGGTVETIEGSWSPERFVILEFEDSEQFRRWYDSPEYTEARSIRFKSSNASAILVQGV